MIPIKVPVAPTCEKASRFVPFALGKKYEAMDLRVSCEALRSMLATASAVALLAGRTERALFNRQRTARLRR